MFLKKNKTAGGMLEFPVAFTGGNGNNFGYHGWSEDQEPGPLLKPKNNA
jgi:hypothetical protein